MDEPGGYYTKWSKPDRERHTVYSITYMCNLKNKANFTETRTEWWLPGIRGGENREMQVKRCNLSTISCQDLMYTTVMIVNSIVFCTGKLLRVDLKRSHYKK